MAAKVWGAHATRVLVSATRRNNLLPGTAHVQKKFARRAASPARESRALPGSAWHAFTLVELLIVIAIIIVLAGLILSTSTYVQKKGGRSRAEAEIAAMSAALESYKADNGVYPRDVVDVANPPNPIPKGFVAPYNFTDSLNARSSGDPSAAAYQNASRFFYGQLSGDKNFDRTVDASDKQNPADSSEPIPKSYFTFKPSMLSPSTGAVVMIRDPFGNCYGYSTANQANPNNGYNPTFDLWSTGDRDNLSLSKEPQWIKNW